MRLNSSFVAALTVLAVVLLCWQANGETCNSWLCGLNGLRGQAAFEEIAKFESDQSQRILTEYQGLRPLIQKRLTQFEQEIAATSYRDTLRLCVAYRRFAGYGDDHSNDMQGLGDTESFSFADSVKAWSWVVAQGLYQPIDSYIGLKSDYLEVTEAGFFDFSTWFRSMYVLKFLNSSGFLYGAAHCLNTINANEIQLFASRILIADYWATGVTTSLETVSIGRIISPIMSRWVFRPLASAFSAIRNSRARPLLVLSTGSASVLLGDELICRRALAELNGSNISKMGLSKDHEEQQSRISTTIQVARAYDSFQKSCRTLTRESYVNDPSCMTKTKTLIATLKVSGFASNLDKYKKDLSPYSETELQRMVSSCGKTDDLVFDETKEKALYKTYVMVLKVLIPAIEKFNFSSDQLM